MMTINGLGQCLPGYGAEIGCRVTPKRPLYKEATEGSHLQCLHSQGISEFIQPVRVFILA